MLVLAALLTVQSPSLPQRGLVEERRITETGTADDWVMIGGVTPLPAGDLLISDYRTGALYRFGPDGMAKGRFGRSGDGPGEFRDAGWVGVRGDTIWLWDARASRMSFFAADGRFVRSTTVGRYGVGAVPGRDGTVLWQSARSFGRPDRDAPPTIVIRFGPDGTIRDTLFSRTLPYRQFTVAMGPGSIVGSQPLDDGPLISLLRDGSGWLLVDREVGRASYFTLTAYALDGRTRWSRRIAYTPVPVTTKVVDSLIDLWAHPAERSAPALDAGAVRTALYRPAHFPPVTSASLMADGRIWIRRESAGQRFLAVDPADGKDLFEVTLPPGARFAGASTDRLWVVMKDADDVESLVQYRMR